MTMLQDEKLNRIVNKAESNVERFPCFLSDVRNFSPYAIALPLAGRGRRAIARRVRGYGSLDDLPRGEKPLTPTLSPQERGEGAHFRCGAFVYLSRDLKSRVRVHHAAIDCDCVADHVVAGA
jgi:hypothetical protein